MKARALAAGEEETRLPKCSSPAPLDRRHGDPEPADRDGARADRCGSGENLYDAGILPRLRYVQSFAANPTGWAVGRHRHVGRGDLRGGSGHDQDRRYPGRADPRHVRAVLSAMNSSTDHIGSRGRRCRQFYYPKKQFELTELTYEQSAIGQATDLRGRAGQRDRVVRALDLWLPVPERGGLPVRADAGSGRVPRLSRTSTGAATVRYNPITHQCICESGRVRDQLGGVTAIAASPGVSNNSTGYVVPFEAGLRHGV